MTLSSYLTSLYLDFDTCEVGLTAAPYSQGCGGFNELFCVRNLEPCQSMVNSHADWHHCPGAAAPLPLNHSKEPRFLWIGQPLRCDCAMRCLRCWVNWFFSVLIFGLGHVRKCCSFQHPGCRVHSYRVARFLAAPIKDSTSGLF